MRQQYILVVDFLSRSIVNAVQSLHENDGIVLVTRQPQRYAHFVDEFPGVPIVIVPCSFDNDVEVRTVLYDYINDIRGVVCRGDMRIQYLRKVVPLLQPDVLAASADSLAVATNKRLMREAFATSYPEITPRFVEVNANDADTLDMVEEAMPYPVIVKPANLASSLLIQSCMNRAELSSALASIFADIDATYKQENRHEPTQVIVEQYLEGDLYSIDAYVMGANEMSFCPPVAYIAAKQLGIDDFFLYKRYVPTALNDIEIAAANVAVRKALAAIGLAHSTAHVELVRTAEGWKIIEIGPRIGRFRIKMYDLGYGINHSLNDVKIHVGIPPVIPTKPLRYCAAYSIYPHKEGILRAIEGLDALADYPAVAWRTIAAVPGDYCRFARRGGHALAEIIIASEDEAEYNRTVAFVEKHVYAIIDTEGKL